MLQRQVVSVSSIITINLSSSSFHPREDHLHHHIHFIFCIPFLTSLSVEDLYHHHHSSPSVHVAAFTVSFSYCCCLVAVKDVTAPSSFSAQLNVPLLSSSSAALASVCFCCCVVLLHLAVCPSASHHLLPSLENSSCPCSVLPYALLLLPLLSLLSTIPEEV